MAKFRGSKGSVTIGGNQVLQLTSWEFTPSRPVIDGTTMGDSGKRTDLDIPGGTGTLTVILDPANATAQAALLNPLFTNDDVTPLAAVFQVSTGKTITCNIVPTSAPITAQLGQHVTASISFETDGAITMAWV